MRTVLIVVGVVAAAAYGAGQDPATGPDADGGASAWPVRVTGSRVATHVDSQGQQVLVFPAGFSMSVAAARISGDEAVVFLRRVTDESTKGFYYDVRAWVRGRASAKKTAGVRGLTVRKSDGGRAMLVHLAAAGEVFLEASERVGPGDAEMDLYGRAYTAISGGNLEKPAARQPQAEAPVGGAGAAVPAGPAEVRQGGGYPVIFGPLTGLPVKVERTVEANGIAVATIIGRSLIYQRQPSGKVLELKADNAVVWYRQEAEGAAGEAAGGQELLAGGAVQAVYLCGDVVLSEGLRTIRAEELYYDFERKKGLAVRAEFRTFDIRRGVPIYIRAEKLRQIAANEFSAENVTLTTSEFHRPQFSLEVGRITVVDKTAVQAEHEVSDGSFDARMRDVHMKAGDATIFYWPFLRSNLERPDTAIKSIHGGYDSDFGASVETRWYLWRLLGLAEPEGVEGTFSADYFSERGPGTGAEIRYTGQEYLGRMLGYVIHDRGEDDLGRTADRKNLEPPRELRGRFLWQDRHFLPYNWQLTSEISYLSDENFLESFYRGEFYAGKEQETLVHLKRIEDNWGISILGKAQINDFADQLEQLPSISHHLAGQSLLGDRVTLYSDSQVGRFRQRLGSPVAGMSQESFGFFSERAEVDVPMRAGNWKFVPFVAATVAYEDGAGFHTDLAGNGAAAEEHVWFAEVGGRASTQYWKAYPNVKSKLWDLNRLRHVVTPYVTATGFTESDRVVEQRDVVQLGLSQRLQTKRGPPRRQRTVDWMRLDTAVTFVNDPADEAVSPSRLLWNKPFIPLLDTHDRPLPPVDRRYSSVFGPQRNYFSADYTLNLSDTTAVLGDMYMDVQSGTVEQLDVGFSQLRWPDLSYYVGSRYLRNVDVLDEEGSHAFTFAATYKLDPRYTVVFSQQYDFDYGTNVESEITLLRRYQRMYWGITYSIDESLDRQAVVLSIWPEGVPELALGPRRYMGLVGTAGD